jgi:hypothetical protein
MSELAFIGLDVHARSVAAGVLEGSTGEVRNKRRSISARDSGHARRLKPVGHTCRHCCPEDVAGHSSGRRPRGPQQYPARVARQAPMSSSLRNPPQQGRRAGAGRARGPGVRHARRRILAEDPHRRDDSCRCDAVARRLSYMALTTNPDLLGLISLGNGIIRTFRRREAARSRGKRAKSRVICQQKRLGASALRARARAALPRSLRRVAWRRSFAARTL